MKNSPIILCVILLMSFTSVAQTLRGLDKSPLDIAYFPDHFAHDRKDGQKAKVKVIYSRPYKNNREILGGIIPYGKIWRTGANENTEITFYSDATVAGSKIRKGTYSLFTIPEKDNWTIIFNSDIDYWGAYKYNEKNDVVRVSVKPGTSAADVENFTIQFEGKEGNQTNMNMAWGNFLVKVPMVFE